MPERGRDPSLFLQALHRAAVAAATTLENAATTASVRLSAAELESALRGFEAARGPRVRHVFDVSTGLFR